MKTYYHDHFEHTIPGYALRFVLTFGLITYHIVFFSAANAQSAVYKLSAFILWFGFGFLIKEARKSIYWSDSQSNNTDGFILKKEITKGTFDFWRIHYKVYVNHPISNKTMIVTIDKQAFEALNEGDKIGLMFNKQSDLIVNLRLNTVVL